MTDKTKALADQLFPVRNENDVYDVLDIPPNERKLHTETYDFSIATIYDHLEEGHIYIPRFQRSYVWNRGQASRLIESLIIQCPIPVLYFDQSSDLRFSVIDGNQRLTSLHLFINDEFALKGLTAYPELEGYYFSDLDPRIRRHITNRTLRCIAILPDTHPQIKFDVFERLNTGSVQLTPQELRHGIYHGPLINKVEELAQSSEWKALTKINTDKRMKRSELVLRYIAMANNLENYFKPLSGFLNEFAEKNQSPPDYTLMRWEEDFHITAETMNRLYGPKAFRPFDENFRTQNAINTALFDAQMVAVHKVRPDISNFSNRQQQQLWKATAELFADEDFSRTIGAGTSSKTSVVRRITRYTDFLRQHFG